MPKQRPILTLFLLLLFLIAPGSSSAEMVYAVVDNSFSTGSIGSILEGSVSKDRSGGFNGDPAVFCFADANNQLRLLAISRYASASTDDTFWIYDAKAKDWSAPLKESNWNLPKNVHGVAAKGQYLYLAGYNRGNIVRVNLNGYTQEQEYSYPTTAVGYEAHGEGVQIVGDFIYALFTYAKDPWGAGSYEESKVVKLDRDLNPIAVASVGKNATRIKQHAGQIYVVSYGGKQNYATGVANSESRIDRVNPQNMIVTTLLKVGDVDFGSGNPKDEFQDITFAPNGNVYILAGSYRGASSTFSGGIYKSSVSQLETHQIGEKKLNINNAMGFSWKVDWENSSNRLWSTSNFMLYSYDGELGDRKQFTGSGLGGNLYAFTPLQAENVPFEADSLITAFSLTPEQVTLKTGGQQRLIARIEPATAPQAVTWHSSDGDVVSVTPVGEITAKKAGAAIITATTVGSDSQGKNRSQFCTVTVQAAEVEPEKPAPEDKAPTYDPSKRGNLLFELETATAEAARQAYGAGSLVLSVLRVNGEAVTVGRTEFTLDGKRLTLNESALARLKDGEYRLRLADGAAVIKELSFTVKSSSASTENGSSSGGCSTNAYGALSLLFLLLLLRKRSAC